jgi:2-polyprenyl-3-methyl-5-hydroxy-6-metoxy-1,4-benzoquinol methylase
MRDRCNLCSNNTFEIIKPQVRDDKITSKVFRCAACGHIQLLPKPTEDEDREFYNKNLQDKNRDKWIEYEVMRQNSLYDSNRHVRLIQELRGDTGCRLLDVGCGYGFFLAELYRNGYRNIMGTELGAERRELALTHSPVDIIPYDVNRPDRDPGSFDVVTLFHVLEHVGDPVVFLRNLHALLAPGGMFVCEVPNVNELLLETCREYNDFYWIRAHLNYFSGPLLLNCLNRAGFHDVQLRYEQRYGLVNLCNWLTTGKPQVEKPAFEISPAYKTVESFYRQQMESSGRSDAIIAVART